MRYNCSNKRDCENKKIGWITVKDRETVDNRGGENELPMLYVINRKIRTVNDTGAQIFFARYSRES